MLSDEEIQAAARAAMRNRNLPEGEEPEIVSEALFADDHWAEHPDTDSEMFQDNQIGKKNFDGYEFGEQDIQPELHNPYDDPGYQNYQTPRYSGNTSSEPAESPGRTVKPVKPKLSAKEKYEAAMEEDLFDDEPAGPEPGTKAYMNEVIWESHPSWKGMISWYLKGLGIALVISLILFGLTSAKILHPVLFVFGVIIAFTAVIAVSRLIINSTIYTVTRSQVMERRGIVNTQSETVRLERITNVRITRNMLERLLGLGKIDIDTANDTANFLHWWGVRKPNNIEKIIDDLRTEREYSAD